MPYVIIPDQERRDTTDRIMQQYGADRDNPELREAAEVVAARQQEAVDRASASAERRYFPCR